MPEVEKICSKVGIIRKGKLIAYGSPSEITSTKKVQVEIHGHGLNETILSAVRSTAGVIDVTMTDDHLLVELEKDEDLEHDSDTDC